MTDLEIEENYGNNLIIAGVDEAGRGALAGPVVAAAVIIDQQNLITGIKDSKKISTKIRKKLYHEIISNYSYSIGIVSPQRIDHINILEATKEACEMAISLSNQQIDIVLVDGNMQFNDSRFRSIVKGDSKSMSIAAASIIAKVTRDQIMHRLSLSFPIYKWDQNFGYGTNDHIRAIVREGRNMYHRKTFRIKKIDNIIN